MKHIKKRILSGVIALSLIFTDSTVAVVANSVTDKNQTAALQTETNEVITIEEAYITDELVDLRTEYSKTYEKSDGSRICVVSSTALHYYDENEKSWEEFNNTLQQAVNDDGEQVLTNKDSELTVEIPVELDETNEITAKSNEYEISIMPLNTKQSEVKKIESKSNRQKSFKNKSIDDYLKESLVSDKVEYEEVYQNTTLEYEVINNALKETIILSQCPEKETSYKFELYAKGLAAELNEDGSINFKKNNNVIFVIPSPFMTDSEDNYSDDIKTELIEENGRYILTYTPSIEWLSDEARVYPVSIDPTITLSDTSNIEDAYVHSGNPDTNYGDKNLLQAGRIHNGPPTELGYESEHFAFIKFNELPENIWNNSYITKANLNLCVFDSYDMIVNMHEVESEWNESEITYNNMPQYNEDEIIEYKNLALEDNYEDDMEYYDWDITDLVEKWYSNPEENYGVMLESSGINYYPCRMYSSELRSTSYGSRPYLTIEYASMTNSTYANSRDIDVGKAGSVNINDFTGNVRLTRNDLGVEGNIMPVSISMIYDQNNLDLSSELITDAYGIGFRTNYSQRLLYNSEKEFYTYIGEDARPIYFEKITDEENEEISFVDEAERGFEISVSGTDYSDYANISITDENGYEYFFDSLGRLVKIADMNLSAVKEANVTVTSTDTVNGIINISYVSSDSYLISQISDGVGRVYQFNYDSKLTGIIYKGSGEESLKTVTYSYNTDGNLVSVVYPGNKTVSYEWNGNNLSKVTNADGYNFAFTYTDENLPRVQTIKEYASDGTLGENISVSYSVNKTIYTDNKTNEQEVLQFDKYGNLLTSQNAYGYTLVNQYGSSELNTTSNSPNELINSFGYQKSEINMLSNTRALNGNSDWNGAAISTDECIFGTQSFKLTGTSSTAVQNINLVKDQTYVFSAYVKTKNVKGTLGATIQVNSDDVTLNSDAQYITGSSGWTRVATTFTADSNCTAGMTLVLNNTNTLAEAYFDGIQLEKGTTVSEYNYVVNSDFNDNTSWNSTSTLSETAPTADSEKGVYCLCNDETPFDSKCIKLFGDARYSNSVYQEVTCLNGQKGDTYNFGGWAKANAVVLKDNRAFGLKVEFYNGTEIVGEPCSLSFNSYISDWQYNMSSAVAENSYTSVVISAVYDYQLNFALFDRIQLQYAGVTEVEETSEDDSTEDSTVDESSEEDTTVTDEHGREIEYTDEDGVKTITAYDDYDNVTRSATQINGKIMESLNGYTTDGNYQTSETNALGKTTTYNYDTELGLLKKVTDAEGNSVSYTYNDSDNISQVTQSSSRLSYSYDNGDRLTGINAFIGYSFGYDNFGALSSINLGSQNLVEYSYDDNYILSKVDYANDQTVNYDYDESGNKLSISSDNSEKYSYYYDDFGNLLSAKDNVNNVVTSYSTDEDGIEYTQERKNNTLIHSYYNKESALIEYLNGQEKETIYSSKVSSDSDTEPLLSWVRTSWKKNGYDIYYNIKQNIDEFGRASTEEIFEADLSDDMQTESDKDLLIRKTYEYTTANDGVNQSEQVSKIKYEGTYNKEIVYTYDDSGNIISDGTYEYTYDNRNRLRYAYETNTGINTDYTYNENGNLINIIRTQGPNLLGQETRTYSGVKLTSYNGNAITYDDLGNPLSYYDGTQFTWQMGRQLASATLSDGTQISYKYNADGLRTEKVVGGTTTSYTLIGSKITGQTDGTNTFYFRYDENDNLLGFELNGNQYFYITNLVGDIIAIVDNQGAAVVEYTYSPWGACTISSDTSNCNLGTLNPFRYRGYYYDEDTGFYYLQSRYYDPVTQLFINADDPSMISSENIYIYTYCCNDPINITDETGYESVSSTKKKQSDGSYKVTTKIKSWITTLSYKYTITKNGIIKFTFSSCGSSYWSAFWRGWGKTLSKEMLNVARTIDKEFLKGRTSGGIHTELALHYAAWKCKIKTDSSKTADIGAVGSKNKGYDSNAWFFETAGASNLVVKIVNNGPNVIKSAYDIWRYL